MRSATYIPINVLCETEISDSIATKAIEKIASTPIMTSVTVFFDMKTLLQDIYEQSFCGLCLYYHFDEDKFTQCRPSI